MNRLNFYRTWLMVSTVIVFLTFGVETLKEQSLSGSEQIDKFILVLLAVLAASISGSVVSFLFGFSFIRAIFMGGKHVEGHWLLLTKPNGLQDCESPLLRAGIAYMSYDQLSQEFRVQTTRLGEDGHIYTTQSEVAHIRTTGPNIRYLNYFKLSGPNHDRPNGFSSGEFATIHQYLKRPITFEANISVQNEQETRRQFGMRISGKVIKKYRRNYGSNWLKYILHELQKIEDTQNHQDREMFIQRICVTNQKFAEYLANPDNNEQSA